MKTKCQHCGAPLKRAMHKNLAYCNNRECYEERRELAFSKFYPHGARWEVSEDGKWLSVVPLEESSD